MKKIDKLEISESLYQELNSPNKLIGRLTVAEKTTER